MRRRIHSLILKRNWVVYPHPAGHTIPFSCAKTMNFTDVEGKN